MTGIFILDWGIISVSLFNTILLAWLGLSVLLNAGHRDTGVWLMGGGLLAGAAFFVSHTAILGQSLTTNLDGLNFWWQLGWIPVIVAPFAWYIVILWYGGFWDKPRTRLFARHVALLTLTSAMGIALVSLLLFAGPIVPTYEDVIHLNLSNTPTVYGIPVVLIIIPTFTVVCIGLSLDVLLRPAPAKRPIIEVGRHRSRTWLLATAGSLLAVSLLVASFVVRVVDEANRGSLSNIRVEAIGLFDLGLAGLIAAATLLLGQAIVAYEVFTGRVLPRRGLTRHWRLAILLAASYAVVIGWVIVRQVRPIYGLLLTTLLMVAFYALYSWRTFLERDQFTQKLRPFVTSQRLLAQLINPRNGLISRASELFHATCAELLGTEQAALVPLGPLAPMVGGALIYPAGESSLSPRPPADLSTEILPLNPEEYGGYRWAVPLWTERGLIGVLFIGRKIDAGLYTQEEMEVAQASGERIIDMLAGERMSSRLMHLQRKRLAENRVTDLRTRRVLHDTVLPALHSAILQISDLSREQPVVHEAITALTGVHQQISDLIRFSGASAASGAGDRNMLTALRRLVEEEFGPAFEHIQWKLPERVIPPLDPLVEEVLFGAVRELVRNAAVHGRGANEQHPLNLTIEIDSRDALYVRVVDDGVGIGGEASLKDQGGSGGGLELHRTLLAVVGGDCTVEPARSGGTQATIVLPWSVLVSEAI